MITLRRPRGTAGSRSPPTSTWRTFLGLFCISLARLILPQSHRLRRAGSVAAAGCGAAAIHPPALGWGRWRGPRRKHRSEVSSWRLVEDERGLQGKRGTTLPGEAASPLSASSRAPGVKPGGAFPGGKEQRGWSGSQEGGVGVGKALGGLGGLL